MRHRRSIASAVAACLTLSVSAFGAGIPNHSIAFAAEHEGGLHYVDPSGRVRDIEIHQNNVGDLTYSAKRRKLAFFASTGHDRRGSLYLLDVDRISLKVLLPAAKNRHELYRPTFDPSGDHLYAVNYWAGIFRYSFRTGLWDVVKVLGRDQINPQGVSFSPSGRKVAISHDRYVGFLLAEVTAGGFHVGREILADFDSVTSPQWLSDSAIVFAGRKSPGRQYLWKMYLRSGAVEQLTRAPMSARNFLSVSGDSKTIVFTGVDSTEPLEWRLWEISVDGSKPIRRTTGGELSSHLFPTYIE